MFFDSIDFGLFLPLVFAIYWLIPKNNFQIRNVFLIFSSCVFYSWWDWRFLLLIVCSIIVDYNIGLFLSKENSPKRRKTLLLFSIIVNIGILGFFKYFNFFLGNINELFSFWGYKLSDTSSLNIILPIGISFYTFQTLSYTIDVYRRKIEATNDFIAFSAFVCFFPQLVAGPIERATKLLPQFYQPRVFEYNKGVDGLRQILWGLFKKVVIADNCAVIVNMIFLEPTEYSGSVLLLGAILFSFQIYGDFSGYSDIAIGTARLFGINLSQNFAFPYFSRNIAEFWRRWHISLSTWFRDYVYIPLGGSKVSKLKVVKNIFIIFIVSGFWHGAKWNFIIWGMLNALLFLPLILLSRNRKYLNIVAENSFFPSLKDFLNILLTFFITTLLWVFFRADSLMDGYIYLRHMFSESLLSKPSIVGWNTDIKIIVVLIFFFIIVEWVGRKSQYAIENIKLISNSPFRWVIYLVIILLIFIFEIEHNEFIYFQF